jgi:hypothetical protein
LAARHAAASDVQLYADACTTGAGIGLFAPAEFSAFLDLSHWHFLLTYSDTLVPVNINVLEFVGAVLMAVFYILLHADAIRLHPTTFHIHIWTDNMAAYWYIRRHRANYPVFNILLQMLTLLQLRYHVLITVGHIPGKYNIYSDAISRLFLVPNGPALRLALLPLPHYHLGATLTQTFVVLALLPLQHPFSSLRAALTALELIIGLISVLPTGSL